MEHIPVLLDSVIHYLRPKGGGIYIDATLGGGGHAESIVKLIGKSGRLIAIDQDLRAIEIAKKRLSSYSSRIKYVHNNFRNLDLILKNLGIKEVDGILFDLGVSAYQLEDYKRGFSFNEVDENLAAPLDMRMDRREKITAEIILNNYTKSQLEDIFSRLGEDRYARRIARAVVLNRKSKPLKTVGDLLAIIKAALPLTYRRKRRRHYATNIFRAIRMEVNQELPALREGIIKAMDLLKNKGRLVVISFHSLEDRIVKQEFKNAASQRSPLIKILTKKPVIPSKEEIERNPKARSAKLRVAERLALSP